MLPNPGMRGIERRLTWVVGSPRSGSTWFSRLLSSACDASYIHEPLAGLHLGLWASAGVGVPSGQLSGRLMSEIRTDADYFFSDDYAAAWEPALRRLILTRFRAQIRDGRRVCIVHEPNGSEGAPLLMRVLPRSRMIFLLRDGRDVIDSLLDAWTAGSWLDDAFGVGELQSATDRLRFIEEQAHRWAVRTRAVKQAYEAHPDHLRLLVRYEDLRQDTAGELRKLFSHFTLREPPQLDDLVKQHSFENVKPEQRGKGKFHRAAQPGGWAKNLNDDDIRVCEAVMGPLLAEFGYESTATGASRA
ncbi:MAG TPA: sulfotransferase [Mycobacteriales bacterium]|nr:sulfotransferase [Mycobacteriales bacterium]